MVLNDVSELDETNNLLLATGTDDFDCILAGLRGVDGADTTVPSLNVISIKPAQPNFFELCSVDGGDGCARDCAGDDM